MSTGEFERIDVESADGTRLNVTVFPAERPTTALLVVHGLQSHAGWIEATGTGQHLAEQGVLTCACDRRGSGRSAGIRGHADSPQQFLEDLAAARDLVMSEMQRHGVRGAPLHVLANCFGTRVVLPFLLASPGAFDSVALTSPATHMSLQGDYGLREKVHILTAAAGRYFDTPLRDEDFVRQGRWLEWLRQDERSLRACTASFLRSAGRLTRQMRRAVGELDLPLQVLTAADDVLVRNDAIVSAFETRYRGPLEMRALPGDHYMDFTEAQEEFRSRLAGWVLGGWSRAPA